ncbi:MAG: hypothetical protein KJS92_10120, partial [Bacteroidetes bacterium]|nr:hypothetical protein [Bacteroidota bacterium]
MQWSIEAGAWLLLPIILLSAAFTWLLYRNHPFRREDGSTPPVVWLMALLRFLALFLVLLLLLSPIIRLRKNQVEQPLLLIFADRSHSIGVLADSARIAQWYQTGLNEEAGQVFGTASVRVIPFGCGIEQKQEGLQQPCTDMERAFREAADRFAGQHIGAVVVISDGLATAGLNPAYLKNPFRAPLYTLGMGDTAVKRDLYVRKAEAPRVVFMGNELTVEADISAKGFEGKTLQVLLQEEGNTLAQQTVKPTGNPPYARLRFPVQAKTPGLRKFKVVVLPEAGEWSLRNNSAVALTEVVDEKQKVAVVYAGPHPDIGAMKAALAEAPAFETSVFDLASFKKQAAETYDLIIWHQIPGVGADASEIQQRAAAAGVNMFYILGPNSRTDVLGQLEPALRISAPGSRSTEAQGMWNSAFSGFVPEQGWEDAMSTLPPMQVPFGNYARSEALEVAVWQKIGSVNTSNPLIAFSNTGGRKSGFVLGDGLWRWRMYQFARSRSHEAFDRFLLRLIRYCAVRGNRKLFRVEPVKQVFGTDEYAVLDGVLLDKSMTAVAGKRIQVQFEGPGDFRSSMAMSPSGNGYRLEAGNLPPGTYRYKAVIEGMPGQSTSGTFMVMEQQRELQQLQADWQAMRQLSRNNGGIFAPAA